MTKKIYKLARPGLNGVPIQISGGRLPDTIKNNMVRELLGGQPNFTGELVIGKPQADDCYERSLAFAEDPTAIALFVFWIYDMKTSHPYPLKERINMAEQMMGSCGPNFQYVDHAIIETYSDLQTYNDHLAKRNFKTIILREPYGTFGTEDETVEVRTTEQAPS